jgi:serine O-acetyltransferase
MRKLDKISIQIINLLLGEIIILLSGGIFALKAKLIPLKEGYFKRLNVYIYEKKLQKSGSWIGYRAIFAEEPVFPHGIQGIFISHGAKIGAKCVIFHQVTIGSNAIQGHPRYGSPEIGDACYIGTGAKIIGNVKLGNNVRVGANCVVVKDVPDNCVVVAQSPRIIQKENIDNEYHVFTQD